MLSRADLAEYSEEANWSADNAELALPKTMARMARLHLNSGRNPWITHARREEIHFRHSSLSVLNHLGRNLYRSFATVLGEAISNSWDADAENVWLWIDKNKNSFFIKDDGVGMNADDFRHKFLKIGYSKRTDGGERSAKGRPFIGRKGIGKLALLSCAERIVVISKTRGGEYIGGSSTIPASMKQSMTI